MNTPAIVVCAFILLLSVLGHFLPGVTRPDMFFGVTVDPAFRTTDPARRMLRDYRIFLWCSAVAGGGTAVGGPTTRGGIFHLPDRCLLRAGPVASSRVELRRSPALDGDRGRFVDSRRKAAGRAARRFTAVRRPDRPRFMGDDASGNVAGQACGSLGCQRAGPVGADFTAHDHRALGDACLAMPFSHWCGIIGAALVATRVLGGTIRCSGTPVPPPHRDVDAHG